MARPSLGRRLGAEFLGTAFLLATVVGSGIMGERLAGGNVAVALLANTLATGAILVVLINMLGPISGAHFNPAVSLVFAFKGELPPGDLVPISVHAEHVLLEGVRRYDTSCRIRQLLTSNLVILAPTGTPLPPEIAGNLSDRVQELLGFSIHPPFMGHVGGLHPKRRLQDDGGR